MCAYSAVAALGLWVTGRDWVWAIVASFAFAGWLLASIENGRLRTWSDDAATEMRRMLELREIESRLQEAKRQQERAA